MELRVIDIVQPKMEAEAPWVLHQDLTVVSRMPSLVLVLNTFVN